MSCCDAEPAELYVERTRRARKPHRCTACREVIQPGTEYCAIKLKFEGDFESFKQCPRCRAMYRYLVAVSDDAVALNLDCGHTWSDVFDRDPPPEIAALAFWRPGDALPGDEFRP